MSQQPKVRPLSPNDPKNPKTKIKPAKIIRRPPTPKLPRSLGGKSLSDSVVPLRRVIVERSKNVRRQQASLANKIDQRGGPKSAAEADVVNRENARQEGQAGNKAAGARAKRQVGRTGKKYLFGRLRRAIDRTKRRADKHRETGTDGAAVHRAKEVEAELWDRKLSAKHENTDTNTRYLKYLRIDEISAEKYDAMSGKERSEYAGKVARRYRRMAAAKQAKDKNFTPDKDLSRPLSAHREIKDRAYARAGRHEELKKLRARRKQPIKSSGMGGRDRGEEMAREAGDRR